MEKHVKGKSYKFESCKEAFTREVDHEDHLKTRSEEIL